MPRRPFRALTARRLTSTVAVVPSISDDQKVLVRPLRTPAVLIVTVLALDACAAGAPSPAVPASPVAGHAAEAPSLFAANADASGGEKQRVPKTERRHKPDTTSSKPSSGSDSDDSGLSCSFDCLDAFFSSLVSSPKPPPNPALEAGVQGWAIGERGVIHASAASDSVWLWDGPGGADVDRAQAGRLANGTSVIVLASHAMGTGSWLRVRPVDQAEPVGWIADTWLIAEPPPESTPGPVPSAPRRPPTWGVMLALGGGGVGPADLNVEYSDGAVRIEAQYLRFLPKHWQTGAGVGWRDFDGQPRTDYAYPGLPTFDEPSNSKLQILDIGLRAGTRTGRGPGFRFWWLLGPTLFHVHESADIRVIDSGTGFQVDERREQLSRWAAGGDVRLGIGWLLNKPVEIGLVTDFYMMAWKGHHELSLTTDFTGDQIHGFDVALEVTWPAR
jgi:hypothetical protein